VRTCIELFCGMGGASAGLLAAGVEIVAAVDAWDKACEAHRRWHPGVHVVQSRCEDAGDHIDRDVDLVWASPSCKPWSLANRTPKRGKMHPEYYSLARLVGQAFGLWRARWLIVENVGGLAWSREGKAELDGMRAAVASFGRRLTVSVVNGNTVGVAQIRRRVFVVVGPEYMAIPQGRAHVESRICAVDASGTSRHANWTRAPVRTLAECCDLQQVPLWTVDGFGKATAHALVGNAVPPPLARHVVQTLLRGAQP